MRESAWPYLIIHKTRQFVPWWYLLTVHHSNGKMCVHSFPLKRWVTPWRWLLWLWRMLIFLPWSRPHAFHILLMYAALICPPVCLPFAVLTRCKPFGDISFDELMVVHAVGCVQSCFWNWSFAFYTKCHLSFDMLISESNDVLIKIIWVHNHRSWFSKRKESNDSSLKTVTPFSIYKPNAWTFLNTNTNYVLAN